MAQIKQLKEKNVGFYPLTVGEAVIFLDGTNAEVTEAKMDEIFDWSRNAFYLTLTDTDNYLEVTASVEETPHN